MVCIHSSQQALETWKLHHIFLMKILFYGEPATKDVGCFVDKLCFFSRRNDGEEFFCNVSERSVRLCMCAQLARVRAQAVSVCLPALPPA